MNVPEAYIEYLIEFHATRDFFECHELLEEYWKEHPSDGLSELWVMCIQIAVGQYHERRQNRRGAELMYQSALGKLIRHLSMPNQLGLDMPSLQKLLEQHIAACKQQQPYLDMMLPIDHIKLLEMCRQQAEQRGLHWGRSSSEVSEDIIHRHLRRDRSEVIQARAAALRQSRHKK
ncbi:DUF309 domain-containing protein [Paenibacillus septentrionalis]|uniref:DUF309 domain-containing protein n=1 Tax=Paenibacillus septentrionalis TaxID=429342 RepID=A0ABW1V2J7_9BACL